MQAYYAQDLESVGFVSATEDESDSLRAEVERLRKEDDPALETLRMQVAFDAAYVQRQEALEKERAAAKRSYSVIEQSICALKLASTKDVGGMGQMHRLIIAALLTKTGQNTQNEVYQKEVAAALESVLPRANLHAFTSLAYSDKRDRLADLHDRPERLTRMPNDLVVVQEFVEAHRRVR